jgi:microcystin-dependent protein
MAISNYPALFSLIGTTYGGDGTHTFALPDLRNRVPIHRGQSPMLSPRTLGSKGGAETVSLQLSQLARHNHTMPASSARATAAYGQASNAGWANTGGAPVYGLAGGASTTMGSGTIAASGGGQPHENLPPYLVVNFIIALNGNYPSSS